jgi:iron(III) transport system permease protein
MTRRAAPPGLVAAAGLVAALAVLPVAYLAWVVLGDIEQWWSAVWSARAFELLVRSVGLALAVTATTVAIALPISWLTVRTDLPGRGAWSVLCALPLVIPSYIGAYLLVSALGPRGELQGVLEGPLGIDRLPSLYGFAGAWLALALFTFPYVLLPLQAVLRRMDPSLEEAARGMGRSGWAAYRSVVLPQLLPAIGAGSLLVSLYVLSDFGAVSIMRFDSFTRVIYVQYQSSFDRVGAASLATLLVLVTLVILWLEARSRRSGALHRSAPGAARPPRPVALGAWRWPALGFCALVVGFALALPIGMLVYWTTKSIAGSVDWAAVLGAAGNSLLAASLAAAAAVVCATPVALLAARYRGRVPRLIEGGAYLGHALPGIVVALALVFFATRAVIGLYQTLALLVVALVVLFLPQAVGALRAAALQVDPRLEEAARSLGRSPTRAFLSVTAPLLRGGAAAGGALVFLTAVKELPATLILAPIGFDTLAIDVWRTTSVGFYERGAVPSLLLLLVSAVPMAILVLRQR